MNFKLKRLKLPYTTGIEKLVIVAIVTIIFIIVFGGVSRVRDRELQKNDIREYIITRDVGGTETIKANGFDISPGGDILFYRLEQNEEFDLVQRLIKTYAKGSWKDVKESGQN